MTDQEKYITVSKARIWSILIAYTIPFIGLVVYMINKNQLTFDNQAQKITTIENAMENAKDIREIRAQTEENSRKQAIFSQIQLQLLKTVDEIKSDNKENFAKVGQDLEQIKNNTKRR